MRHAEKADVLSCDLSEFRLALWTLFMRISESIRDHVCAGTNAVSVDFVGVFVINKEEDYQVTGNAETIW